MRKTTLAVVAVTREVSLTVEVASGGATMTHEEEPAVAAGIREITIWEGLRGVETQAETQIPGAPTIATSVTREDMTPAVTPAVITATATAT